LASAAGSVSGGGSEVREPARFHVINCFFFLWETINVLNFSEGCRRELEILTCRIELAGSFFLDSVLLISCSLGYTWRYFGGRNDLSSYGQACGCSSVPKLSVASRWLVSLVIFPKLRNICSLLTSCKSDYKPTLCIWIGSRHLWRGRGLVSMAHE